MKKFLAIVLASALTLPVFANEGMWLPLLLGRNYEDMKAHGLQLTPEQLYSINNSSIKDAIVSLGGFCTAEVISKNGLLLTNHHCGFDAIQTHSTTDNNLLDDGFWAKSYEEELPNEGLFVRFLVRMEDVTAKVNAELTAEMTEKQRDSTARVIGNKISDEATEGNDYDANVKSFYHGNEFYLFVYETFRDVRLVGAPPSSVGKFGGDTDNWMWPRHTGDFSMFRVYTNPDGKPAEYSAENIPMKPKHHLPISLEGVKQGDFTMIFGYPGGTDRYLSSYGVKQAVDIYNPSVVEVRDVKLAIMKKYMDQDDSTRIQYASKYARVSNYWKYFIGQTEQLKKNKVAAKKLKIENDFRDWVNADNSRKKTYGETLNLLEGAYNESDAYVKSNVYALEAGLTGSDLTLFAFRVNRLMSSVFMLEEKMEEKLKANEDESKEGEIKEEFELKIAAIISNIQASAKDHFKNYNSALDQERFATLFALYDQNIAAEQEPEFFAMVHKKYKGDWGKFSNKVYSKSFLRDSASLADFLAKPSEKALQSDMAAQIGGEMYSLYLNGFNGHPKVDEALEKGYRLFTAGVREMNADKNYYPDANSTMRMTYGTVGSYFPRDGVFYDYYTTTDGILQKEDPNDMEFKIQEHLIELIKKRDFGIYADKKGELPVCFISNNDITGGNSGSPVINGKGELIGCAFDGNWEAMSGDIFFEKKLQRTISVDIRYVLFIVDKYAGATNIIEELTFAKRTTPPENHLPAASEDSSNGTEKAQK